MIHGKPMKKQFPGYYRPNSEEFAQKFQECVFCFDTNVLLNLYRYTPESRDNLIEVLRAFKGRIWLPHQVGREYQRGRTDVFLEQLGLPAEIARKIDNAISAIGQFQRSSLFAVNALTEPVREKLEEIKQALQAGNEEKPDLMTGDLVFDAVTELFDGKVGGPLTAESYQDVLKKAKERYDAKIPPGYLDKPKDPNDIDEYGDLVLWWQLLEFAKGDKRPIIFVTDDAKEDWWRTVKGQKLGPRPELVDEFLAQVGDDGWFYMYSTEQFLKHAKDHLDADVTPEAIKEVEGIGKQHAEQERIRIRDAIVSCLRRSPHSFQWFRENTEFRYTDEWFDAFVTQNPGLVEKVRIVSRDKDRRRIIPGRPGMRLTRKSRRMMEEGGQP